MKLILELDIKNGMEDFVMELFKSLSFVKTKPISNEKLIFLEELKEAVNQMKLIKQGKSKGRVAGELLNEL